GLANHHGVMDAWAKANVPDYVSRAGGAPTVALTPAQHAAANEVFWAWQRAGGGSVSQMSAQEAQALSQRMFDAARVPSAVQQQYFRAFSQYIYSGRWSVGP